MFKYLVFSIAVTCSTVSFASPIKLLGKSFAASQITAVSPNKFEILTTFNGQARESRIIVEVDGVDFAGDESINCLEDSNKKPECVRVNSLLSEGTLAFKVKRYAQKNVFVANVYVANQNIKYIMISQGWYKHDYRQNRDKYSVLMQKQAKCMGLGMWSGDTSFRTDLECN